MPSGGYLRAVRPERDRGRGDRAGARGHGRLTPGGWSQPIAPSRSPAFALHPLAQDRIDPAEMSLAFCFEPGEDIVVNAERDL